MSLDFSQFYQQAQNLIDGVWSKKLVINDGVFPHWIGDSEFFWYQRDTHNGKEYRLVNANLASNNLAFNHEKLAVALQASSGQIFNSFDLDIIVEEITLSPLNVYFMAINRYWVFNEEKSTCTEIKRPNLGGIRSPDHKKEVFVKDYNIWLRDLLSNQEEPLTVDGSQDYAYGKAAFTMGLQRIPFEAVWSPDSKFLLTYQLDLREVKTHQRFISVNNNDDIEPEIYKETKAYPGDDIVEAYRLVAIETGSGKVQAADYHKVPICRIAVEFFSFDGFGWWDGDGLTAYFVDVGRGAKNVRVVAFDPHTGATRIVMEEFSDTFISLSHGVFPSAPLLRPLPNTRELIWFSERDGWGHLYLYDLTTGRLKNQITCGEWVVREILHVCPDRRELIVQTSGRDSTISPYYKDICRINIDSGELTPLAEGNFEHNVFVYKDFRAITRVLLGLDSNGIHSVTPSGTYFVTTRSRVDCLPESVLIDRKGNEVLLLEVCQDVGLPSDWHWPEPVSFKGADRDTDLHGVIFRPLNFSSDKLYPVLDYSNTVCYVSSLPQGSFINDVYCGETYLMGMAYAALGFIVVIMDVPGMPCRHKSFHDKHYGRMDSVNSFDDRVSGIKQLAERYPYMDIERVGIVDYDGATAPALGLLHRGDFYKVGVNVEFEDPRFGFPTSPVVEMYEGVKQADKPYDDTLLEALEGKLLLVHGLQSSKPPAMTLQLISGFLEKQKSVDMLLEPLGIHCVTSNGLRCTWDYLVRHLLKISPPKNFQVISVMYRLLPIILGASQKHPQYDSYQDM